MLAVVYCEIAPDEAVSTHEFIWLGLVGLADCTRAEATPLGSLLDLTPLALVDIGVCLSSVAVSSFATFFAALLDSATAFREREPTVAS